MKNDEIRKLNFDGWPISDEYLIEVGRVTMLWTAIESLLNICIGKLAGLDPVTNPTSFILINHSSLPQKLDNLGALCEHLEKESPNLKSYKPTIEKLKTAQKLRNKFTHNGLVPDPETGKVTMPLGSARGTLKTKVDVVDIADIRRASMAIHEAQLSLYELTFDVKNKPVWERRNA
jgi:hypothetical protein